MSEVVTTPSLMMVTSLVSKESLARDTHTHTDTYILSILNFLEDVSNFENKKEGKSVLSKTSNKDLAKLHASVCGT